jgi:hypothetical protein
LCRKKGVRTWLLSEGRTIDSTSIDALASDGTQAHCCIIPSLPGIQAMTIEHARDRADISYFSFEQIAA